MPPLAVALALIYIPSFFHSFQDTAQYKVISDELDIIVRETVAQGDSATPEEIELLDGVDPGPGPLQELDVEETIQYEEREPKVCGVTPSSEKLDELTMNADMAHAPHRAPESFFGVVELDHVRNQHGSASHGFGCCVSCTEIGRAHV